jgi:hypothetical protein
MILRGRLYAEDIGRGSGQLFTADSRSQGRFVDEWPPPTLIRTL